MGCRGQVPGLCVFRKIPLHWFSPIDAKPPGWSCNGYSPHNAIISPLVRSHSLPFPEYFGFTTSVYYCSYQKTVNIITPGNEMMMLLAQPCWEGSQACLASGSWGGSGDTASACPPPPGAGSLSRGRPPHSTATGLCGAPPALCSGSPGSCPRSPASWLCSFALDSVTCPVSPS